MEDEFDLQRFIDAQRLVYPQVRAELRRGQKSGHWMWFIFPQLLGLGSSAMARRYALVDCNEAIAYLAHPVLGLRLRECTQSVLQVEGRSIERILGAIDATKLRSSMTLFAQASDDAEMFEHCLKKYFAGIRDPVTLKRLTRDTCPEPDDGPS